MKKSLVLILLLMLSLRVQAQTSMHNNVKRGTVQATKNRVSNVDFSGTYKIRGWVYRMCEMPMELDIRDNGKGNYTGTLDVRTRISDEDPIDVYGYALVNVKAKAVGNVLTVSVVDFTCDESEESLFSPANEFHGSFKPGQTILKITKTGSKYKVNHLGLFYELTPYKDEQFKMEKM